MDATGPKHMNMKLSRSKFESKSSPCEAVEFQKRLRNMYAFKMIRSHYSDRGINRQTDGGALQKGHEGCGRHAKGHWRGLTCRWYE